MSLGEILVVVACALFVIAVIIKSIIDKKNGKTCSGDCSSCSKCNLYIKEKIMDKYLKCSSCGAIVKVIKPCNCKDCGIQCCGKPMVEIPNPNLKGTGKILTCSSCGAQVEVVSPCNCPNCGIQCCGKQMI